MNFIYLTTFICSLIFHLLILVSFQSPCNQNIINLSKTQYSISVKLTSKKLVIQKKGKESIKQDKNIIKNRHENTTIFTKAKADGSVAPKYPWRSRMLGEEGTTIIKAFIGIDGKVYKAEIQKTSSFKRLDNSAVEAVLKLRFSPAHINKKNITSVQRLTISYKLDD